MADRDLIKRIDGHIERGNQHMERGNELMQQNREAFERGREAFELFRQEIERSRHDHEEFRIFLRDLNRRNERVLGNMATALRDLSDQVRANTAGTWAMVDQIKRLGAGGEGATA
jgi:hypothetical protein